MVDFSTLGLPGFAARETDPKKIFQELPAGNARISNLWSGQEAALDQWYALKDRSDVVIELNTGAGKSLVGLLLAESAQREGRRVVYVCPTTDLVEQVAREADNIGLQYSKRTTGGWSDDGYKTGRCFAITNYDSLLTPRSKAFKGDNQPETIIFDDAHVAEAKIRDQYALHVQRTTNGAPNPAFQRLAQIIIESAPDASWRSRFEGLLNDRISGDPRIAPMDFGARYKSQLDQIFLSALQNDKDPNFYVVENLYGKWDRCVAVFGNDSIDILAPIPPILTNYLFADRTIRRIYLSATLTQESDFARAFGRRVKERIRPDVDAGDGERLVVMTRKVVGDKEAEQAFIRRLTSGQKALFAVPTASVAKRWDAVVKPVPTNQFSAELNRFRQGASGHFIMVGRFDGIDLPHDQCRLMVIDGLPTGGSLMERFTFDRLNLRAELAAKVATRLTQLFGRINRGQKDFGIYVVASEELKDWLGNHRNLALMPDLLRRQILLGAFLQSNPEVNTPDSIAGTITQVLSRDPGWTSYYSNFIRSQKIEPRQADFAAKREERLSELFLRQGEWFSRVWQGDFAASSTDLEEAILSMSAFDQKSAGVADLWLGLVKGLNEDREGASAHYESAQGRLLSELPFERVRGSLVQESEVGTLDSFGRKQVATLNGSPNTVSGRLFRNKRDTEALSRWDEFSFRQLEEATRALGEAIGYDASRPDSEKENGPDGIWLDLDTKAVLGIELKTEKFDENNLTKDEVGQCHNHEQWVKNAYPNHEYLGLVVVTDSPGVSGKSSPSPTMFKCSSERMRDLRAKLIDIQESLKPFVMRGDLSVIRSLSNDSAWTLNTIASYLKESPLIAQDI